MLDYCKNPGQVVWSGWWLRSHENRMNFNVLKLELRDLLVDWIWTVRDREEFKKI